jgi:hypothetical protein
MMWTSLAGVIFLAVGVHDLLVSIPAEKSGLVVAMELAAGIGFLLNAGLYWRKNKAGKL